jgi:hypothetical protein
VAAEVSSEGGSSLLQFAWIRLWLNCHRFEPKRRRRIDLMFVVSMDLGEVVMQCRDEMQAVSGAVRLNHKPQIPTASDRSSSPRIAPPIGPASLAAGVREWVLRIPTVEAFFPVAASVSEWALRVGQRQTIDARAV